MCKGLKSLAVPVAGRLLCLGLAVSSCLLPQNDDPLPEIPLAANRAPRIDPDLASPQLRIENKLGMGCPEEERRAVVDDLDVKDLIRIKWRVFDSNGVLVRELNESTLFPTTMTVRRPTIKAPATLFTMGPLSATGTGRKLELVVADGEFTIDGTGKLSTISPVVDLRDGGTVVNKTYYDTYTWTVDTTNMPCTP